MNTYGPGEKPLCPSLKTVDIIDSDIFNMEKGGYYGNHNDEYANDSYEDSDDCCTLGRSRGLLPFHYHVFLLQRLTMATLEKGKKKLKEKRSEYCMLMSVPLLHGIVCRC